MDGGEDVDTVTTPYTSGDIATSIYVVDVSAADLHTCCHTIGEVWVPCRCGEVNLFFIDWQRAYVGLTASTIYIVYGDVRAGTDVEQDTGAMCHLAFVSATVEVVDGSLQQVPCRLYAHRCLVVSAKHADELVVVGKRGEVDTHGYQSLVFGILYRSEVEFLTFLVCKVDSFYRGCYVGCVVDAYIGCVEHVGHVTATIYITVGTAADFEICLVDGWGFQTCIFACGVVVVAVTSAEELADEYVFATYFFCASDEGVVGCIDCGCDTCIRFERNREL